MVEKKQRRRLFLALWPDDIIRKKLADVQTQLARSERLKTARPTIVENHHITIHFLGDVTEDVYTQLEASLSEVKAQACSLVLDQWGYFPRAQVLWLGATATPGALIDLVAQTQVCIQHWIESYDQKRFVPHVTLFRKARHPLRLDDFHPIEWPVDHFALVESVTHPEGPEYTVLKQWSLS